MQSQQLRAWNMGSQVLGFKSMTWILTCQRFLKVRLGTCAESWVEQKTSPNSQQMCRNFFGIK
jgi:hypothetical protein